MYFVIYSDIKIVQGINRSSLIDFRSESITLITNEVANFLSQRVISVRELSSSQKNFLSYLEDKELGFYCNSKEESLMFPELNETFEYPAQINNAIVEIGDENSDECYESLSMEIKVKTRMWWILSTIIIITIGIWMFQERLQEFLGKNKVEEN